jgi:ABC-type lipoprotein export system ATPase subunit
MNWYLGLVRDLGVSELRVIVGDYGSGKTHFLWMTGQLAFRKNKTSSSPRSP